jgi:hypothetical protein
MFGTSEGARRYHRGSAASNNLVGNTIIAIGIPPPKGFGGDGKALSVNGRRWWIASDPSDAQRLDRRQQPPLRAS